MKKSCQTHTYCIRISSIDTTKSLAKDLTFWDCKLIVLLRESWSCGIAVHIDCNGLECLDSWGSLSVRTYSELRKTHEGYQTRTDKQQTFIIIFICLL